MIEYERGCQQATCHRDLASAGEPCAKRARTRILTRKFSVVRRHCAHSIYGSVCVSRLLLIERAVLCGASAQRFRTEACSSFRHSPGVRVLEPNDAVRFAPDRNFLDDQAFSHVDHEHVTALFVGHERAIAVR